MKKELAFLTNIPTPYKTPLFKELSTEFNITVYYMAESESNRNWKVDFGKGYKAVLLKGITLNKKHINFSIIKELLSNKYEAVIISGFENPTSILAMFLCIFKKIKYIIWHDGGFIEKECCLEFYIKKFFIKRAKSFWVSGTKAKELIEHYGGNKDLIYYSYLTVDINYFKNNSKVSDKEKSLIKNMFHLKEIVILSVARMSDEKGIKELLYAFKKLNNEFNNISLLLVGEGKNRIQYENIVNVFHITNVGFTGHLEQKLLPLIYGSSNIFVLPTKRDPWGLVINEAMASGLPIISTDKAGASYDLIKENANGFIIKENIKEELYEKMKLLIEDNELRNKFAEESSNIISEWTYSKGIDSLNKLLEHI